jgi:hypothetical protein
MRALEHGDRMSRGAPDLLRPPAARTVSERFGVAKASQERPRSGAPPFSMERDSATPFPRDPRHAGVGSRPNREATPRLRSLTSDPRDRVCDFDGRFDLKSLEPAGACSINIFQSVVEEHDAFGRNANCLDDIVIGRSFGFSQPYR